MLKIYQSNRIDVLEGLMEFIIQNEMLGAPFDPEIILVSSPGMAQWIQFSIAEKHGISANIQFPKLTNFIWDMFVCVFPYVPKQSAFNKRFLVWKLMTILPKILEKNQCAVFPYYLEDSNNKQKLFQFSMCVAELYDQYSIYRPDWLMCWESGKQISGLPEAQIWQALLWKSLAEHTAKLGQSHWHRANLYERFISTLKNTSKTSYGLPARVFIFGIPTLPPIYLRVFEALSKHIDIHILFFNPCRYFWGDAKNANLLPQLLANQHLYVITESNQSLPREATTSSTAKSLKEYEIQIFPNPLLASFGKLGCDYIDTLSEITESSSESIDAFVEVPPGCLLNNLQRDILELQNNAAENSLDKKNKVNENKYCLKPEDHSVTIHVCHSVQREVEVLHDNILKILDSDHDLNLRDIVVMVPDVKKYTPFIQGVFDSISDERYLPYQISDCRIRKPYSILETFTNLLSLSNNRFLSEDVLALLDIPALASRFNINEEEVCLIRQWVKESGIRWGMDDDNVQEFSLPITGQHTWKFGLTRMLLGYAMESVQGEWNKVLPYDNSGSTISDLIGKLASLLMHLNHWKKKLTHEKKLETWLPVCRDILHDFFLPSKEIEEEIEMIEQQWRLLIEEGLKSYYNDPVPISLLRDEVILRINKEHSTQYLLSGQLNICSLTSIRSVPFKVICLIGMNDGIYPKSLVQLDFDLIAQKPQRGDCNRHYDDRYAFLEAIISAQKKLYISYIGYSIRNNRERFPSVLVQEVIDYITQSHYMLGDESKDCDDREKRVKSHILFFHSSMPFDSVNFLEKEWQSYAREWLPVAKKTEISHGNFIQELDDLPLAVLNFENLQYFWMHPVRAFFQMRLGVNFQCALNVIPNTEPFTLDNLTRYQLNQRLLQTFLDQEDEKKLFSLYRASGELPYGAFGEIAWDSHCKEMHMLAKQILKYRKKTVNYEINLECEGVKLIGWLYHVQSNGILRWHAGMMNVSQRMKLWLEHLVYCAHGGKGESRLFARKNKSWHFPWLTKEKALCYLLQLINGYKKGMKKPLLLLLESSGAWIQTCYDSKNHRLLTDKAILKKARERFLRVYKGNSITPGEGNDIWYKRLRLVPESANFDSMVQEANRYLLPLYKFNQSV